jgi:alkanesulfonate monooxygenase SsuD/methylene tetrahydromethanopterin reductase-like flavin-dependent oxidoreductase (luciferase family)
MWREVIEQVANMMVMDPYPGFQGEFFSMPTRNVVPKPVQKPHPPMWVACSNRDTIHLAAQLGLGALTFAFVDPEEAQHWVTDYYETFKRECVPVTHVVNPNIAMVSSFSCHPDEQEALRRGTDGFRFFQFALGHFYAFGKHRPGRTNIWERYEAVRDELGTEQLGGGAGGIGTPAQLRDHLRKFADAGVDQAVFIQQGGNNLHENICEDLDLFAREVMPEFKEQEEARLRKKDQELAPYIEAALARKERMPALEEEAIPTYEAYGYNIAEVDVSKLPAGQQRRFEQMRQMRQIVERFDSREPDPTTSR